MKLKKLLLLVIIALCHQFNVVGQSLDKLTAPTITYFQKALGKPKQTISTQFSGTYTLLSFEQAKIKRLAKTEDQGKALFFELTTNFGTKFIRTKFTGTKTLTCSAIIWSEPIYALREYLYEIENLGFGETDDLKEYGKHTIYYESQTHFLTLIVRESTNELLFLLEKK